MPRSSINRQLIAETGIIPAGYSLIQDSFPFKVLDQKKAVTEDAHGRETPTMKITGLIQMGDRENANGRVYSTGDVLAPAVRNIQEDIAARKVPGEFDHPADAKIHLDRVSHLMTKIWMEGKKVYGEAEILYKLPMGACLRGLFEHKVQVGISSRGVGDMEISEQDGKEIFRVLPGYAFVTWDVVQEPSVNGAILNIREGLNRRVRPLQEQRSKYKPETYQKVLVDEINKYFGLK